MIELVSLGRAVLFATMRYVALANGKVTGPSLIYSCKQKDMVGL